MSLTLLEQWCGFWFYVALMEEPDKWKCFVKEHTVFHPYPRRLEKITVCKVITKAAPSSQLIKDPEHWSSWGFQQTTYHSADQQVSLPTNLTRWWFSVTVKLKWVRWLNTVLAVCVHMSFAKSWQEKGCSSQADTWKLKNILMKDFDWQIKCDICGVAMATWAIDYNLKISLFHSLHKIRSLDFPINLHTAYYN